MVELAGKRRGKRWVVHDLECAPVKEDANTELASERTAGAPPTLRSIRVAARAVDGAIVFDPDAPASERFIVKPIASTARRVKRLKTAEALARRSA